MGIQELLNCTSRVLIRVRTWYVLLIVIILYVYVHTRYWAVFVLLQQTHDSITPLLMLNPTSTCTTYSSQPRAPPKAQLSPLVSPPWYFSEACQVAQRAISARPRPSSAVGCPGRYSSSSRVEKRNLIKPRRQAGTSDYEPIAH